MSSRRKVRISTAVMWLAIGALTLLQIIPDLFGIPRYLHGAVQPIVPSRFGRFFLVDLPRLVLFAWLAVQIMRVFNRLTVRQALQRMGLFTASRPAITAGFAALGAQATIEIGIIFLAGATPAWQKGLPSRLLFVLFGPVFMEEMINRGFVLRNLRERMRPWIAIVISAMIFVAIHFNTLARLWSGDPGHRAFWINLVQYLLAGLAYGYLYVASGGSLPACMIAHFGGDLSILVTFEGPGLETKNLWYNYGGLIDCILGPLSIGLVAWIVLGNSRGINRLRVKTQRKLL